MSMPILSRPLPAAILCAALAACAPSAPAPSSADAGAPVATTAQAATATIAEPVADPGAGPDADGITLPPDGYHGSWRVLAADDPHDAALMTVSIQSSAGEPQGSGDYVLFQPFCDALAGQPIIGTSECELIGQAAAFDRVQATPERIVLVFHPTADGAEQRLELHRDGERLVGDYVAEGNDVRRAVVAGRTPDDPPAGG